MIGNMSSLLATVFGGDEIVWEKCRQIRQLCLHSQRSHQCHAQGSLGIKFDRILNRIEFPIKKPNFWMFHKAENSVVLRYLWRLRLRNESRVTRKIEVWEFERSFYCWGGEKFQVYQALSSINQIFILFDSSLLILSLMSLISYTKIWNSLDTSRIHRISWLVRGILLIPIKLLFSAFVFLRRCLKTSSLDG